MPKRVISDVSDREFDGDFNAAVAIGRMPTNLAGGLNPMTEYKIGRASCRERV